MTPHPRFPADDPTNAQSCWAAAGCSGYDSSANEFIYEDFAYDAC